MNDKGDDSDGDVSFSAFPQRSKPDCILKGDPGVASQGNDNCEEDNLYLFEGVFQKQIQSKDEL